MTLKVSQAPSSVLARSAPTTKEPHGGVPEKEGNESHNRYESSNQSGIKNSAGEQYDPMTGSLRVPSTGKATGNTGQSTLSVQSRGASSGVSTRNTGAPATSMQASDLPKVNLFWRSSGDQITTPERQIFFIDAEQVQKAEIFAVSGRFLEGKTRDQAKKITIHSAAAAEALRQENKGWVFIGSTMVETALPSNYTWSLVVRTFVDKAGQLGWEVLVRYRSTFDSGWDKTILRVTSRRPRFLPSRRIVIKDASGKEIVLPEVKYSGNLFDVCDVTMDEVNKTVSS